MNNTLFLCLGLIILVIFLFVRIVRRIRNRRQKHSNLDLEIEQTPLSLAEQRGKEMERLVYEQLKLLPEEYSIFCDSLFEHNGYTVQVDHIVVSPYALFVIESKGHRGLIVGSEDSDYWEQYTLHYKYRLYNPIKQNNGHIRFIKKYFKIPDNAIPIISLIVFSDETDLEVDESNRSVLTLSELIPVISSYSKVYLSPEQREYLVNGLHKHNHQETEGLRLLHLYNVQNKKQQSEWTQERKRYCPQCRGELVIRQSVYGVFWGCSTYPKCCYKERIERKSFYRVYRRYG